MREIPVVLRAGLYAVPALIGATIVVVASEKGIHNLIVVLVGAATCFILRRAGLYFDWSVPRPRIRDT